MAIHPASPTGSKSGQIKVNQGKSNQIRPAFVKTSARQAKSNQNSYVWRVMSDEPNEATEFLIFNGKTLYFQQTRPRGNINYSKRSQESLEKTTFFEIGI